MVFLIMDVLHFLFWINTVIHVLPETPIRKVTGRANPKIDRISQSEMQKIKCKILYRDSFVFAQYCVGAGRKIWGCRKKLPKKGFKI